MKITSKIALGAVGLIAIGIIGGLATYKKVEKEPFKIEKTAPASFTSVKVNSDSSKIIVKKADISEAQAVLTGSKKANKELQLNSKVSNNVWNISVKDKGLFFFDLSFLTENRTLTVYLPEKDYKDIFARTDNGRVIIQGLAGTSITAESDNGRLDIKDSTAKRLEARTDNGKITFNNTKGEVYARADNGRIDYIGKEITDNIDFAADNGRLQITVEEKPDQLDIDAYTDNGSITVFGQNYKDASGTRGEGPLVKLRTDNGKIDISQR